MTRMRRFVILTGRWSISFGETGAPETIVEPFDMIAVPPGVMHGLTNIADFAIVPARRSGRAPWRPPSNGHPRSSRRCGALGHDAEAIEYPGYTPEVGQ